MKTKIYSFQVKYNLNIPVRKKNALISLLDLVS